MGYLISFFPRMEIRPSKGPSLLRIFQRPIQKRRGAEVGPPFPFPFLPSPLPFAKSFSVFLDGTVRGERGFSEQQHVTDQLTRISLTSCTGVFAYSSLRSGVVKFFVHWKLLGGSHTLAHYRSPPRKSRLKKV